MAKTRKVTVTVPEDVAATLEKWRDTGRISSVSEYVTAQVQAGMARAAALRRIETVYGGEAGPARPPLEAINRARRLLELPELALDQAAAVSAEAWATEPGAAPGAA
jgi:Arc/MetJ-type ribon-helix-helix transcriptional regulator